MYFLCDVRVLCALVCFGVFFSVLRALSVLCVLYAVVAELAVRCLEWIGSVLWCRERKLSTCDGPPA